MSKSVRNDIADIDIKHVGYFLMLAKHGSISKAANALGLAQPSLSEHIVRLETRLNTKLAIRGPRGITLTEAGRLLTREGHKLIEVAQALTNSMRELGGELQGTVSVALPPSLSMLSIPLVETLRIEAPGVKLHLSEGLSGYIIDWLQQEQVDMGFVYSPPLNASCQCEAVLEEELFLVAAEDNVPGQRDADGSYSIEASQLRELPLIMPSMQHSYRIAVERFARASGIELNTIIEMDSLSQIADMVNRASAYAVLPHISVAEAVTAGRLVLVRIRNPTFKLKAYLTRKRSRTASMASLTVERILQQILVETLGRQDLHAVALCAPKGKHAPVMHSAA